MMTIMIMTILEYMASTKINVFSYINNLLQRNTVEYNLSLRYEKFLNDDLLCSVTY